MQVKNNEYNPAQHELYKALTLPEKHAELLTKPEYRDASGEWHAACRMLGRGVSTRHRGEVLICSQKGRDTEAGRAVGLVDLVDVIPIADVRPQERAYVANWDWNASGEQVFRYVYVFRNPRQVIDWPVELPCGFSVACFDRGDIETYPTEVSIGATIWARIRRFFGQG